MSGPDGYVPPDSPLGGEPLTTGLQTKKEQVYNIIKRKILMEEYTLGQRIHISRLAADLGVSNSPIREALNSLEKEGLVINGTNTGSRVVSLTASDMYELAQMLFFWVSGAYLHCVHTDRTGELCAPMSEMLRRQKASMERKDAYWFTCYADYFDRCIIEAVGNKCLLERFDSIFPLYFLGSLYSRKQEADWRVGFRQHEEILTAIKENRHDDVMDALAEHYYKPAWDVRGLQRLG